ncbi:MAG: glycosyltransferase family 2 protein [Desulfobacterales bacterium]|nr:glycosyltransferase family 2 protein [Desulfobacterales bacterium]
MNDTRPKITICIPHWQVKKYISICLRPVRKHSENYDLQVIVVDNGSKDESLDYLRSLNWILLLERPEEVHTNWPGNVFTAWDYGISHATGDYYVTMHSDVFVKEDGWLDPMLREITASPSIAAAGAWKLHMENPVYAFQKRATRYMVKKFKQMAGMEKNVGWKTGHYPRDYCAMYRRDVIIDNNLQFTPIREAQGGLASGGGYSIATQLWNAGFETRMVPLQEMRSKVAHIAHGTAAVRKEKPLRYQRKQKKLEARTSRFLSQKWIKELEEDQSLDQ